MKILKKGNFFVAYRDENDKNTPDGVGMNDRIKIGDSLGKINIKSEKFIGNTISLLPLSAHLEKHKFNQKRKRVWNVILINSDDEQIDQTQIDEKKASLAWELFKEFGHEKKKGMRLEWQPEWEVIED